MYILTPVLSVVSEPLTCPVCSRRGGRVISPQVVATFSALRPLLLTLHLSYLVSADSELRPSLGRLASRWPSFPHIKPQLSLPHGAIYVPLS